MEERNRRKGQGRETTNHLLPSDPRSHPIQLHLETETWEGRNTESVGESEYLSLNLSFKGRNSEKETR